MRIASSGTTSCRCPALNKRIRREHRDHQEAGLTAIAAPQLFGRGVKLRPGQNIEYVITNSESHIPNDRV
jgi:DNA polymerase elongation subunit (family B)